MRSRLARTARTLVLLVLVAVLVFFAGGGWYFSGQIHEGALAVEHAEPADDLTLNPQDGASLALDTRDPDVRALLLSSTTYGVQWDGGYGQVTGAGRASGTGEVVRDFTLLSGTAPDDGARAHLDRSAFPADPEVALGQPVQDVTYRSGDAALPAWFVPGVGGNSRGTWAILVHGKGVTRTEMLRPMRDTVAAGLPSLAVTYRNDEGAPADPSGIYQFGRTEWRDLAAAVEYAHDHGADDVVLVGASMGGGIIASYLEHRTDRVPVSGLVLDAPMLDLARHRASTAPASVRCRCSATSRTPLTWTAERITAAREDVDWEATDYLDDTSWLAMPALVVHGRDDLTVPLRTSTELRDSRPGRVRLLAVPGADHVESWNADPRGYDRAVRSFLASVTD